MEMKKFAKKLSFFSLLIGICFLSACSSSVLQETVSSGWERVINSVEQAVSNSVTKATLMAEIAEKTELSVDAKTDTWPVIAETSTFLLTPEKSFLSVTSSPVTVPSVSDPKNTEVLMDIPFIPSSTETDILMNSTATVAIIDTATIEPTGTTLPTQTAAILKAAATMAPSNTAIPVEPTATISFTDTASIEPTGTMLPTQTAAILKAAATMTPSNTAIPVEPTATISLTDTATIEPTGTMLPTQTAVILKAAATMAPSDTAVPVVPTATVPFTDIATIELTRMIIPTQTAAPIKPTATLLIAEWIMFSTESPHDADAAVNFDNTLPVQLPQPTARAYGTETPIPVIEIETTPQTYQISSFVVTNTPIPIIQTTPIKPEVKIESGIYDLKETELPTAEIFPMILQPATSTAHIEIERISITPQNSESGIAIEPGLSDVQKILMQPISKYEEDTLKRLPAAIHIDEKTKLGFMTGTILPNTSRRFLVSAEVGQQLIFHLENRENRNSWFRIIGIETGINYQDSMDFPVDWSIEVPVTQDYLIEIRSENEPVSYAVIIGLHD